MGYLPCNLHRKRQWIVHDHPQLIRAHVHRLLTPLIKHATTSLTLDYANAGKKISIPALSSSLQFALVYARAPTKKFAKNTFHFIFSRNKRKISDKIRTCYFGDRDKSRPPHPTSAQLVKDLFSFLLHNTDNGHTFIDLLTRLFKKPSSSLLLVKMEYFALFLSVPTMRPFISIFRFAKR